MGVFSFKFSTSELKYSTIFSDNFVTAQTFSRREGNCPHVRMPLPSYVNVAYEWVCCAALMTSSDSR